MALTHPLSKRLTKGQVLAGLTVLIPFAVFLIHASLFRTWIIDDAGISFAYARNLVHGYGLVSQPGVTPVEGFSNFTWVMLVSPFLALSAFDPILTPKVISCVLVLMAFLVIRRVLVTTSSFGNFGTSLVLTLIALNTSFVVWSTSGLENALYALLVGTLCWQLGLCLAPHTSSLKPVVAIALVSALCALTRPDGMLYCSAYPILALGSLVRGARPRGDTLRQAMIYLGIVIGMLGSYWAFRIGYFGDVLPNTFYAKSADAEFFVSNWFVRLIGLVGSLGPLQAVLWLLCIGAPLVPLSKSESQIHVATLVMLALSMAIYVLLPGDWMGEYRFATPFFVLCYLAMFQVGERMMASTKLKSPASVRWAVGLLLVAIGGSPFPSRSLQFSKSPPVPFSAVAVSNGIAINTMAEQLGQSNASVLLPDIGGALYYSKLKIYDLAGLTDKTIARTLRRDHSAFYDYVFSVLRPTFIRTHTIWSLYANFDADPRFRRDYLPIYEYEEPNMQSPSGAPLFSGDYVRKDAIVDPDLLLQVHDSWLP